MNCPELKSVEENLSKKLKDVHSWMVKVLCKTSRHTVRQFQVEAVCQKTLKNVVRTVIQEEDRAKNVMVFGMEEADSEFIHDRVRELITEIGEKKQSGEQKIWCYQTNES